MSAGASQGCHPQELALAEGPAGYGDEGPADDSALEAATSAPPSSPAALAQLSHSELCAHLEAQANELIDLGRIVGPLTRENVRLARGLKQYRQMFQEVLTALRAFFSNPDRRTWFQEQKEDVELISFFQRLIAWYRKFSDSDKDPILLFYRRIWEYERGDCEEGRGAEPPPERAEAGQPASAAAQGRGGAAAAPQLSSARLYDACLARSESLQLQEQNHRLREENTALQQTLAALELEVHGFARAAPDMAEGPPAPPGGAGAWPQERAAAAGRPPSGPVPAGCGAVRPGGLARPPAARTLEHFSAEEPRWRRLLEDPSGLFSGGDVVDETYEQYLEEVLKVMDQHGCCFKRAVELSAEAALAAAEEAAPGG